MKINHFDRCIFQCITIVFIYSHKINKPRSIYFTNQGFGSVTFLPVVTDLLDTDPPKNALYFNVSKREFYRQRF